MLRSLNRLALACALPGLATAQLSIEFTFNPSNTSGICGLTHGSAVWAYGCFGATLDSYDTAGNFLATIPRPGNSANDVDLDVAVEPMSLGGVAVPAGSLLFFDGESGVVEAYAVDPSTGAVIASLVTAFGNSHVVGGSYHPVRDTLFFVQDRVPGGSVANTVAEVDRDTGAVLGTFSTSASGFSVNFGDLDVGLVSGNIYIVSSDESTIAEFLPDGTLVRELILPPGVSGLSAISVDDATGRAWVASSSGTVWLLGGVVLFGSKYCSPAATNSTGSFGTIAAFGTPVRADNSVTLLAAGLPTNANGYFLTSLAQGFVMNPAGSQGNLCLSGQIGRYVGPGQIQTTNSSGLLLLRLDLSIHPTPTGLIDVQPGDTWHFQSWYRDSVGGQATSNFTDGLSLTFS